MPSCWTLRCDPLAFAHNKRISFDKCTSASTTAFFGQRSVLLQGPEIRTGFLEDSKPVKLTSGKEVTLTTDYEAKGNQDLIACRFAAHPQNCLCLVVAIAACCSMQTSCNLRQIKECVKICLGAETIGSSSCILCHTLMKSIGMIPMVQTVPQAHTSKSLHLHA